MTESVYTNKSLDLLFRILTLTGIFMPQSFLGTWRGVLYRIYSCFMVIGTLLIYLSSHLIDIIMNLGDLDQNIETGLVAISLILAVIKTINTILKRQSIKKIRDMLDGPTLTTVSAEGSKHLLKPMSIVQLFVKLYMFVAFGTTTLWNVNPILDKSDENTLPSKGWFPWDTSEQKTYMMLYGYQVIAITIMVAFSASQDLLISSVMILAVGQLDVLCAELSALGRVLELTENEESERAVESESAAARAAHVNERLRLCIIRQTEIVKFVALVEYVFSPSIFAHFLGSGLTLCVIGFKISQTRFSVEFVSLLFYMTTMTAELLLFCYPGNEIMLKSQLISSSAYECAWYNQDIAFRKKLTILMERSKRPLILTAGRILPLTLETFTSILRSSYSYYAVLQSVQQDDDVFPNAEAPS